MWMAEGTWFSIAYSPLVPKNQCWLYESVRKLIMDKVMIKDLLVRGIIGINDWERKRAQDILINIILFTDTHRAGETDSIADCVNYSTMSKKIQAHAESVERLTVEALANDLAKICLEDKGVQKVILRVEKPGAVRFAKSVGVEIERSREE
jgi:FolB domain-containing protein